MASDRLLEVLTRSRDAGFLGPGPVEEHIRHARVLATAVPAGSGCFIDLGSGGGVPGLVLAVDRPDLHGILLDGSTRRGAFLHSAVTELRIADRIEVVVERAEVAGHSPTLRGRVDVVLARSFGPPAVVAECGAPFLVERGRLIVSDPPGGGTGRWDAHGLRELGLVVERHEAGPPAFTVLCQVDPCPSRFPRRVGVPAKRPLF